MFDFFLQVSTDIQPIEWKSEPFSVSPWTLAEGVRRIEKRGPGWSMTGLAWDEPWTSFGIDGDGFVAAVGEPYAGNGWKEAVNGPAPAGRINGEILVKLWRLHENDIAFHLSGDYVIISLDGKSRHVILVSGRQSLRYLHYHVHGNRTIVTTSLHEAARLSDRDPVADPAALVETALFAHPLGERTLWKGYSTLQPGEIVEIRDGNSFRDIWFNYTALFSDVRFLPRAEATELGREILKNALRRLCDGGPKIRASLTSGFDSRLNWSIIDHASIDLLGYAFGVSGSINLEKPKQIAERLGFNFRPIPLDEEFDAVFPEYAMIALRLMDGLASFERANYPYAFRLTRSHSPFVMTGTIGSELLRTFQNIGWMVTGFGTQVALSNNPLKTFLKRYEEASEFSPWVRKDIFILYRDEVHASVWDMLGSSISDFKPRTRFYLYLMRDALRKWFGSEILSERPFGTHRTPFWDDTFLDNVFRFPFAGIAAQVLKPTITNRFRSQRFYAEAIHDSNPALLVDHTDHGFPPSDLITPFGFFKLGARLLNRKLFRKRPPEEFRPEYWDDSFLKIVLPKITYDDELFNDTLFDDFHNGSWRPFRLEYTRTISQAITHAIWRGELRDFF